jgi:hypothetical protein
MKTIITCFILGALITSFSCKKVCYSCSQYCAYCVNKQDSSIAYKICANKTTAYNKVDSFYYNFTDSNFICNKLTGQKDVCDNQNSIQDGISYYEKEDYFCAPK